MPMPQQPMVHRPFFFFDFFKLKSVKRFSLSADGVLFVLLEKGKRPTFSLFKRKSCKKNKQTCGLIACAAFLVLLTLIFMIFDRNIENLKAREGGLRWNS